MTYMIDDIHIVFCIHFKLLFQLHFIRIFLMIFYQENCYLISIFAISYVKDHKVFCNSKLINNNYFLSKSQPLFNKSFFITLLCIIISYFLKDVSFVITFYNILFHLFINLVKCDTTLWSQAYGALMHMCQAGLVYPKTLHRCILLAKEGALPIVHHSS